jgi:hypothetical protein
MDRIDCLKCPLFTVCKIIKIDDIDYDSKTFFTTPIDKQDCPVYKLLEAKIIA